ncbi:MAG TPA: hypothetical protein VMJ10_04050, partial [Kofleriaceae bacterium]|nr:hypothetical protein [Kofleriaceae bacterium]
YQAMFAAAVTEHHTPYDIIRAVGESLLDMFAQHPNIHKSLRQLRSAAEVHERIDAMLDAMIDTMTRVLVATRHLPAERARDIAFVLVHGADGIANAIATSSDREQGRRVIQVFAEMASSLLHG